MDWTKEAWVMLGFHTRIWVTRKGGEQLDNTCLHEEPARKRGWMFRASMHGNTKGLCLFWRKQWDTIDFKNYCEKIVPIIDRYIRLNWQQPIYLKLMQDSAPEHVGKETRKELHERKIYSIYWLAFSPDLNSIEAV